MKRAPETLADIHPDALYSASEVARVLGLSVDSVYRLGQTPKLRKVTIGPRRGKTKFRGSVILKYVEAA